MFPHMRAISYRAILWIDQHVNHLIMRPIKSTFKAKHQVSQESLEGGETRVTKQLTSTATPRPLKEDPESIIIRYPKLAHTLCFIVHP